MSPRTPNDHAMDATDFFNEGSSEAAVSNSHDDDALASNEGDVDFDLGAAVERDRVAAEHARIESTIPDAFEPAAHTGWLSTLIPGALLCVGGIGLGAWFAAAPTQVPAIVQSLGLSPFGVFATGAILWAIAWSRKAQTEVGNRTDAYTAPLHDMLAYVSNRVETAAESEEIERSIVALARLDEKIQNLSRATKMYGKPLMDVASKVQEAASSLQEIEGSLNGVVNQVQTSSTQLGSDLEKLIDASKDGFPTEQFDALVAATQSTTRLLSEMDTRIGAATDPLPMIRELRSGVDAVRGEMDSVRRDLDARRTEVSEVVGNLRKQLDDVSKGLRTDLGDVSKSLRTDLGDVGGSLHAKVGELSTTFRSELEDLSGSLRGDVSELGSAISALEERALTAAAQASAAAATAAAASTKKASKAKPTKATPQPPSEEPAAAAPASKAKGGGGGSALANSIAGERRTKGKNVLGAIAKLKQMRD